MPRWTNAKKTEELLAYPQHRISHRRRAGWFAEGIHYRFSNNDLSASSNGLRYEYNVEAIEILDKELSGDRRKRLARKP